MDEYLWDYGESTTDEIDDVFWSVSALAPETVAVDSNGDRWFGYLNEVTDSAAEKGIIRYLNDSGTPTDGTDDTWVAFAIADGAPFDGIREMKIDDKNRK